MRLVSVSYFVRRSINILALFSIVAIVIVLISPITKTIARTIFPPKDLPTVAYGKLDKLSFVSKLTGVEPPKYVLNTKTGRLPADLQTKMTVYKYKEAGLSFEAGKKAQEDALVLGYSPKDLITDLKGDSYAWRNPIYGGVLEIEINSKAIRLLTPLARIGLLYPSGGLTKTQASKVATDLFTQLNRFDDPLYQNGTQNIVLGRWRGTQVVETISTLEAQIARVDFFRAINDFPILGPDAKKGMLHAFVKIPGNKQDPLNYPQVEAYYWELDEESTATYPIITVQQAWNQVSTGAGIVSNITSKTQSPFEEAEQVEVKEVIVNDIYLAYYDNTSAQKYLQPIYVFEGNYNAAKGEAGTITIYYPAIPLEYTVETVNPQTSQE